MEDLNLKIDKVNGDKLTILTGDAEPVIYPELIRIKGDIKTMANFLLVRLIAGLGVQAIDKSKAVVFVDKKARTIVLNLDPENKYGATITSKLETSDELIPFHINETFFFTKDQLVQLIKFNKLFFESEVKHKEMLMAFQKTSSTVNIQASDSKDERGNKAREFIKTVQTNVPTEFVLHIPVFKGFPEMTFRVEVCLDVKEGNAEYWLESVELHELVHSLVEEIFSEQLKSAEGFVIINQ